MMIIIQSSLHHDHASLHKDVDGFGSVLAGPGVEHGRLAVYVGTGRYLLERVECPPRSEAI